MTEINLSAPLGTEKTGGERPFRLGAPRGSLRAVVYPTRFGNRPAIIKDYNGFPAGLRLLIAWRLVRREVRAYRRLSGVEGVPELLGQRDRYAIILQYIPGQPLSRFKPGEVPLKFFDRLARQVNEMHRRGVVHGDIRRDNILVAHSWRPVLIDFNCSLTREFRFRPLKNRFYSIFRQLDEKGVLKLKAAFFPGILTPEESESLEKEVPLYRWGKLVRHQVYRRIKRRFRERRFVCRAARSFWKKRFSAEPHPVLHHFVQCLVFKGYSPEKALQATEHFCRERGEPLRNPTEIQDFLYAIYAELQNDSGDGRCLDRFCGSLQKRGLCRREQTRCSWRQEMADSLNRCRDGRDGERLDEDR